VVNDQVSRRDFSDKFVEDRGALGAVLDLRSL
jgi:hypothetical protein